MPLLPQAVSRPLRKLNPTPAGVGIGAEYINDIINRIEQLVQVAELQKPIAGNNINVNYTAQGVVISLASFES
jgi:hypothetical protein